MKKNFDFDDQFCQIVVMKKRVTFPIKNNFNNFMT